MFTKFCLSNFFCINKSLLVAVIILFNFVNPGQTQNPLIRGADISFVPQIENSGGIWKMNNNPDNVLDIFKQSGANYIRLRLWHSPSGGYFGLDSTAEFAEKIKALGFKFLLDIHYSDTWADPGHQTKPAAWTNIPLNYLEDSVYSYTKNVILFLKNKNAEPDMVQIGNEITNGFLWPDGAVKDSSGWINFAALLKTGIKAVKDVDSTIKIMIHIDEGGNNSVSRWFFDNLTAQDVSFDVIGLSYYPFYSSNGTLQQLQYNLNDLSNRYNKSIIIVETAYPWTLSWSDNVANIVGNSSQLLTNFPATVEGQTNFIDTLINIIANVPDNKGAGFFYWEPDWITAPHFGSSWENVALFDFSGNALSTMSIFNSTNTTTSVKSKDESSMDFNLYQNFPNPFNPTTTISFVISHPSKVTLKVYDELGIKVATLLNEDKPAGTFNVIFNANKAGLASGIYYYTLRSGNFMISRKLVLLK